MRTADTAKCSRPSDLRRRGPQNGSWSSYLVPFSNTAGGAKERSSELTCGVCVCGVCVCVEGVGVEGVCGGCGWSVCGVWGGTNKLTTLLTINYISIHSTIIM